MKSFAKYKNRNARVSTLDTVSILSGYGAHFATLLAAFHLAGGPPRRGRCGGQRRTFSRRLRRWENDGQALLWLSFFATVSLACGVFRAAGASPSWMVSSTSCGLTNFIPAVPAASTAVSAASNFSVEFFPPSSSPSVYSPVPPLVVVDPAGLRAVVSEVDPGVARADEAAAAVGNSVFDSSLMDAVTVFSPTSSSCVPSWFYSGFAVPPSSMGGASMSSPLGPPWVAVSPPLSGRASVSIPGSFAQGSLHSSPASASGDPAGVARAVACSWLGRCR